MQCALHLSILPPGCTAGHTGHVHFVHPLYHPLLRPLLVDCLNSFCFFCGRSTASTNAAAKLKVSPSFIL